MEGKEKLQTYHFTSPANKLKSLVKSLGAFICQPLKLNY